MKTEYAERYKLLGLRIAYFRKRKDMTQEMFAEALGMSTNYISQVEAPGCQRGVSLETLFKMADVLDIPVSKLFEED